ncbi:MAG: hypothetical protein KME16_23705 [Scytolyngbya sp. HA4215-MV1]|jgi:hypothetical protein|nr:hypothetical protein [Scytolyngbya sp. HA4215-MV1]
MSFNRILQGICLSGAIAIALLVANPKILGDNYSQSALDSTCQRAAAMSQSAPILQYIVYGKQTWGTRAFTNGQVDEYSDRAVEVTSDGDFKTRPVPLQWRSRTHLTAAQIEQLKAAIANSTFFDLPTTSPTQGVVHDGATTIWTITLDGRCHEVKAQGNAQAKQAPLESLRNLFEDMVADALSAEDSEPAADLENL